jgi:hypothetical protein
LDGKEGVFLQYISIDKIMRGKGQSIGNGWRGLEASISKGFLKRSRTIIK